MIKVRQFVLTVMLCLLCEKTYAKGIITIDIDKLPVNSSKISDKIQLYLNLAAAKKKKVVIKQKGKKIFIGKTINIPDDVDVDFNNTTIVRDHKAGIFDMLKTSSKKINSVRIINLTIDGRKDEDSLRAEDSSSRFSGLSLKNIKKGFLFNITVCGTVNAEEQPEEDRAGIIINNCNKMILNSINGYNNDRTAIFIKNSTVRINKSYTHNNKGSGISSNNMVNSEVYNIITHDNGYSQLSINGKNNKARFITAYNGAKGFSNINIGHDLPSANASNCEITDVHSFNSKGWGMTVAGSSYVKINKLKLNNNNECNFVVFNNANHVEVYNISSSGSTSTGICIRSGKGHKINIGRIYDNSAHGIEVFNGCELNIGPNITVYNNGHKGMTEKNTAGLAVSGEAIIYGGKIFDNREKPMQTYGIWAAGGKISLLGHVYIYGNKSSPAKKTSNGVIIGEQFIVAQD